MCRQIWTLVLLVTLWAPASEALNAQKAISSFMHEDWQVEDGLPLSSIRSILQTRDGYLWMTTGEGLVRFDGVRFTVFDKANTKEIRLNQFYPLYEDFSGYLWAGTSGSGLYRYNNGTFTRYSSRNGLTENFVASLAGDKDGLWVGTLGSGLNKLTNGTVRTYKVEDGLAGNRINFLLVDRTGTLWIGTVSGLSVLRDGHHFTTYTTRDGLSSNVIQALEQDNSGNIWIGTSKGMNCMHEGALTTVSGLASQEIWSLHSDRAGSLWIGTAAGLYRFNHGKLEASKELSKSIVISIHEDVEGSLWIGTRGNGLHRLKDGYFTSYGIQEGMSDDFVWCVYEDPGGSLWIGTERGGLNVSKNGKFFHYKMQDGLSSNSVYSISGSKNGGVWLGTSGGGLNFFKDGNWTTYGTEAGLSNPFVMTVMEDRNGLVWIGTQNGLNILENGKLRKITRKDGLTHYYVISLYQDSRGTIWIGTHGGGLVRFQNGKFETFTTRNGLPHDVVSCLYEDSDSNLWIGTRNGLSRLRDKNFHSYTSRDGLFNDTIFQILEDSIGNLWMSCNRGIFRIKKNDLYDFDEKRIDRIPSISYGTAHGMRSSECNAGKPGGWKGKDGKLWFTTMKGVVSIDPQRLQLNPYTPPVKIEKLVADSEVFPNWVDSPPPMIFSPGKERIEFHYTALSFVAPDRVQFRYILEGFDREWVHPGNRRVAYYTRVPPGHYRFRVAASNNDGIWNENGASIPFVLKPYFYQTFWFYSLVLSTGLLVIWGIHRLHLQRMRSQFQAVLGERSRIAREIHDTLAQGLTGVVLHLEASEEMLEQNTEQSRKHLLQARGLARDSLDEARRSVWALRSKHLDSVEFPAALQTVLTQLTSNTGMIVSFLVRGDSRPLSTQVEENLLRIAQEAISNVIKHAAAAKLTIEIDFLPEALRLMVQDDGRGFVPSEASMNGHFGLMGIKERVSQINGEIKIESSPGSGTQITISVPIPKHL